MGGGRLRKKGEDRLPHEPVACNLEVPGFTTLVKVMNGDC
jgi:hypothetical protein